MAPLWPAPYISRMRAAFRAPLSGRRRGKADEPRTRRHGPLRPAQRSPDRPHLATLSVAARKAGAARTGGDGGRPARRRQGNHRNSPVLLQVRRRRAERPRRSRGAGGAVGGLWPRPGDGPGLWRAARRGLRQGRPAGGPGGGSQDPPPPARAVAALPSRPQDRGGEPGHRARHQGNRIHSQLHPVQRAADVAGGGPGVRHPVAALRAGLRADHLRGDRRLHRLDADGYRVAHQVPPPHERVRQRRHAQGRRQPDRQVLRQRGARGAAVRSRLARLRGGGGQEQDVALPTQRRPGRHHLGGPDRGHGHGRQRRRRRHHDVGRLRAGELVPDPAVPALELPRFRLSPDQAVAHRHGADVPAPGRAGGNR